MATAPVELHRTTRLNVRLSAEMMEKVEAVAARMGLAGATVGAIAIAEYINKKSAERELMELVAQKQADQTAGLIEKMFSDPGLLASMASAVEHAEQARLEGV